MPKSNRKLAVIFLVIALSMALFVGTAVAADQPYVYIGSTPYTLDWIMNNLNAFNAAVEAADANDILVDASDDGSGKYLNFGAFVNAVMAGNADPNNPAAFQAANPATPPVVGDELKVVTVSAINATTIEVTFNRAPADDETLTYTVAGTAYTPVMDGAKATLTVATLVDDAAVAVVVNDGAADLYNDDVTYDLNQIDEIVIQTIDFNKTIGQNFTLSVQVQDEDDDTIADTEVKLEAAGEYDTNNLEPAVVQTATTNANGVATFTWTTAHDGVQAFEVYSVERPVVRNNGNVTWTLAGQLVTVDDMAAVTLSDGTAKEYIVNALEADGSEYVGDVVIDFSGDADIDVDNTAARNVQVEVWDPVAEAWENDGASAAPRTLVETDVDTATVTLTAAADGTFMFRVYTIGTNVDELTPTIWEDADGDTNLDATEARVVGSTITYVQGLPTFTIEALDTGATGNTIATNDIGGDSETHHKDFKVTAVDQFGNPYRGTVLVYDDAIADTLGGTTDTTATVDIDTDLDGNYDVGAGDNLTVDTTIGGDIAEDDSIFNMTIVDANPEAATFVVFADINTGATGETDAANHYDANDAAVKTPTLTFEDRTYATITIEKTDDEGNTVATNPADGGDVYFLVTFIDQFGEEMTTDADTTAVITIDLDDGDANTANITGIDLSFDPDTGYSQDAGNADDDLDDQNPAASQIMVLVSAGTAGDECELSVFADLAGGTDNVLDADEVSASIEFEYVDSVMGGIELANSFDAGNVITAETGTAGEGYDEVAISDDGTANIAELTLSFVDQSGNALDISDDQEITWTIKNSGKDDLNVDTDADDGSDEVVEPGDTLTVTTTAAAADDDDIIQLFADAANNSVVAEVTATVGEYSQSMIIAFIDREVTDAADVGTVLSGTVVAFSADGDQDADPADVDSDDTLVIVKTTNNKLFLLTITNGAEALTIDGNTIGVDEEALEEALSVGDSIVYTNDDSDDNTGDTVELTNN